MKKLIAILLSTLLLGALFVGCGDKQKKDMTAEQYATALKEAGLPIDDLQVTTAENDKNKLLGRPNQYTSKVNFKNGSIEVFNNSDDLKARQDYINDIGKKSPMFAEYNYANGNALLRINKSVSPDEAKKYEDAFMKL